MPPELTVTKNEIRSSGGFMDPVSIEKLKVDSIGKEQRPVKYSIEYVTTCTIQQAEGKQPVALNEIKLDAPGRYNWSEENVNILIDHPDGFSKRVASVPGVILSKGLQNLVLARLNLKTETGTL